MHQKSQSILGRFKSPLQIILAYRVLYQKYCYVERIVHSVWGPLSTDTLSESLIKCDSVVHINRFFRKTRSCITKVMGSNPREMKTEKNVCFEYTYKFLWIKASAKCMNA